MKKKNNLKELSMAFLVLSVLITCVNIFVYFDTLGWADFLMYGGQIFLGAMLLAQIVKE